MEMVFHLADKLANDFIDKMSEIHYKNLHYLNFLPLLIVFVSFALTCWDFCKRANDEGAERECLILYFYPLIGDCISKKIYGSALQGVSLFGGFFYVYGTVAYVFGLKSFEFATLPLVLAIY